MWIEAEQDPEAFWRQTPRSYQLVMRGLRRRMKAASENRIALAWNTAAFTGATQSKGGLKPLNQYLSKPDRPMSDAEMLSNMRGLAGRVNRQGHQPG